MRQNERSHVLIFLILFMMMGTSFTSVSTPKTLSSMDEQGGRTLSGQILFTPFESTTTYLIDRNGTINHTWSSSYKPEGAAYWLGNGTILRPVLSGVDGGVQIILWNGTIAWNYCYTVAGCICHHDMRYLPNGNVLMIVWETKTRAEAIAAGRDPNTIMGDTFTPDKIIEVKPTGPTSGDVVWEWHVWDHLIQDYDSSKANYGVIGDHPELVDINFGDTFTYDWLHTNSLDYNPQLDQILIDVHNFDEVWVIDHSTTTQEAAGHTGGLYGHGGDLLYRWGNPQSYRRGTATDKKLFGQHDATWIKTGYPDAGDILLFNNGFNRPAGNYSTVDEFTPPVESNGSYHLEPGSAYGPDDFSWDYTANPPTSLYSNIYGGALRLMDGDTLICDGVPGKFFEVTPEKTTVWQYMNPYPDSAKNSVFKIDYISTEEPPNPPAITGPAKGKINIATDYNFTAIDPDGDQIYYFIDWGDHTNSSWVGSYPSGTAITQSHTWTKKGTYAIRAKAKDIHGSESDWSTLQVTMPLLFEPPHFRFFNWLFERFPHAFPILRHLLRY